VAAVFVDFHSETKQNCSWVQFLKGRRPMRSFSPGAVATIALWNSAPMLCYAPMQTDRATRYVCLCVEIRT